MNEKIKKQSYSHDISLVRASTIPVKSNPIITTIISFIIHLFKHKPQSLLQLQMILALRIA